MKVVSAEACGGVVGRSLACLGVLGFRRGNSESKRLGAICIMEGCKPLSSSHIFHMIMGDISSMEKGILRWKKLFRKIFGNIALLSGQRVDKDKASVENI